MNKLKIFLGIMVIASLFFTQCQCQYVGDEPLGSFSNTGSGYYSNNFESVQLPGNWLSINATWIFSETGELQVVKDQQSQKGYWSSAPEKINIVLEDKTYVYQVEVLSEKELRFSSEEESFILTKN